MTDGELGRRCRRRGLGDGRGLARRLTAGSGSFTRLICVARLSRISAVAMAAIVARAAMTVRIARDAIKGLDLLLPRIMAIECFVREGALLRRCKAGGVARLRSLRGRAARQDPATQATIDGAKIDLSDITVTLD